MENYTNDGYESEATQENLRKDVEENVNKWMEFLSKEQKNKLKANGVIDGNYKFKLKSEPLILEREEYLTDYAAGDLRKKSIVRIDSLPGGGKGFATSLIKQSQGRLANNKEYELDDFLYVLSYLGLNDPIAIKAMDEVFRNRSKIFSKDPQTFLYNYIHYPSAEKFIHKSWSSNEPHYRNPEEMIYDRKPNKGIGKYGLSVDVKRQNGQTMTIDGVGSITSIKSPVSKEKTSDLVVFSDVVKILEASFLRDFKNEKLSDSHRIVMRQREVAILFTEKFLPALQKAGVIFFNKEHIKNIPHEITQTLGFAEKVSKIIMNIPDVEIHSPGLIGSHKFMREVQKNIHTSFSS